MANLQAAADAPWILRAGADALLFAHIAGGAVGMASGAVAILVKKGRRLHRVAGTVFTIAMLVMAGVGATVAPFLDEGQWTNTTAGVFTFYLVVTAWAAGKRRDGEMGRLERNALFVPVGIAAMAVALAFFNPGRADGFATVYAIAAVGVLAAVGDLNLIRQGGLSGRSRMLRHIWRMSLALFVAMGSFFFGQPDFVPQVLKDTGLNFVPPLGTVALLVFWVVRTRFPQLFRPRRPAAA